MAGTCVNIHLLSRLLNSVLSATFVSTSLFFSRVICEVYLHVPMLNESRRGPVACRLTDTAKIYIHVCMQSSQHKQTLAHRSTKTLKPTSSSASM